MNFRPHPHDEPEINLIPFIDVLLVVLIFLMLSTTYSKFTELQVKLPAADAAKAGKDSVIIISADASATHQAVITVMEAARRQGLTQITFATQSTAQARAK